MCVVLFVSFFSSNCVFILQKPCHHTIKPTLHSFLFLKVTFSVDEKLVNNQNENGFTMCFSLWDTVFKTHGRYALAYFCDGHICLEGNNAMFTYSSDIFLTQYTCYTAKTKLNDIESLVEVVRHDHTTAYARYHHSNPML